MTTPNSTPVDTATGQIEHDGINLKAANTALPSVRQTFRRTYSHYITATNSIGSATTRANFIGVTTAVEFKDGCASIPYQNLGVAFTPAMFLKLKAHATHYKVHALGFTIKKINMMQENLTSRQQSTTLENTFVSRPSLLMMTDINHQFDDVVGASGLTSAGTGIGANDSRPRLMRALMSTPTMTANVNNETTVGTFTYKYPASQADGGLEEVSFYMSSDVDDLAQLRWCTDEILPVTEIGEGSTKTFVWQNPRPEWHGSGTQPWYQVVNSNNATPTAAQMVPYWPGSRQDALQMYYKGGLFDHTGDNAYDSTQTTLNAAVRAGLGSKGDPDTYGGLVPPYVYIKLPPVWGPVSQMNFTTELWIEYFADIEYKVKGLTQLQNQSWPAAGIPTNTATAVPTFIDGVRNTFGAANGRIDIGLTRKRRGRTAADMDEDNDIDNHIKRRPMFEPEN